MNDITDTKKEMAENLLYSLRGRYLLEMAGVSLVRELNKVKGVESFKIFPAKLTDGPKS